MTSFMESMGVISGAQDDLRRVTDMAYRQVKQLGMSDVVGHLSFPHDENKFGNKPYSKKFAAVIDQVSDNVIIRTNFLPI